MPFANREQAARLLAKALAEYRGTRPLFLAIPRGAVPMGAILARELDGELDVILVRKLGAPGHSEYAIGAVDESGQVYLNSAALDLAIPSSYLEEEKRKQAALLAQRRREYTPHRPPISPEGRVAIVLDDGVATGATMIAALRAVREKNPKKLVAATAVAPPDTVARLEAEADEVVCLETPSSFYAVGQFFEDFSQVEDREVMVLLSESSSHKNR
jgi:predicted phosphoribosyltransferase